MWRRVRQVPKAMHEHSVAAGIRALQSSRSIVGASAIFVSGDGAAGLHARPGYRPFFYGARYDCASWRHPAYGLKDFEQVRTDGKRRRLPLAPSRLRLDLIRAASVPATMTGIAVVDQPANTEASNACTPASQINSEAVV